MLRVFQMGHVMQRHLEGAVVEAAGKLIFSLLSILFIAAGLFYEVGRQNSGLVLVGVWDWNGPVD